MKKEQLKAQQLALQKAYLTKKTLQRISNEHQLANFFKKFYHFKMVDLIFLKKCIAYIKHNFCLNDEYIFNYFNSKKLLQTLDDFDGLIQIIGIFYAIKMCVRVIFKQEIYHLLDEMLFLVLNKQIIKTRSEITSWTKNLQISDFSYWISKLQEYLK